MTTSVQRAWIGLIVLLLVAESRAVDSDGNGIDDSFEAGLAAKFAPSLILDSRDQGVSPEPVEFIDAHSLDGLWLTLYNSIEQKQFDQPLMDVDPYNWDPPLIDHYIDGTIIKSNGNFSTLETPLQYVGRPNEPSQSWAYGTYYLMYHFEYTGGNTPSSWHAAYQNEASNNNYTDKIYVHLFKRAGIEHVIQYWYFFPFNDWTNNHEGDWEHINVVVDSPNPATAQIVRVEYYFHHQYTNVYTPGDDFYATDGTHPVVFIGGEPSPASSSSGYGGHGSYPSLGAWADVVSVPEIEDIDDVPDGLGRYIHWTDFDLQIITDPSAYDFDANPELSWIGASIPWGQPNVSSPFTWLPSLAVQGSNNAPGGPVYNDGWGLVGIEDTYQLWALHLPPYIPVTASGWNMIHIPADYSTIYAGLNAASSGAQVKVNPGIYYESLPMKSGVDLVANYGTATVWPPIPHVPAAVFNGDSDIEVEGITFNGVYTNAVEILNSSDIVLDRCNFETETRSAGVAGLYVSGASSSVDIDQCQFHYAGYGLNTNGAIYISTNDGEIQGKSSFFNNLYGIYSTNNGSVYTPSNNFSHPTPHNSIYDIYATADVNYNININAQLSFWGYQNGYSPPIRTPDVWHDHPTQSINTSLPQSGPLAKPLSDRKQDARALVRLATDKLYTDDSRSALARFREAFETYGDVEEEARVALYGMVAAANEAGLGTEQLDDLAAVAASHRSARLRATAAYLALGLRQNKGLHDEALRDMQAFERVYPQSDLLPYVLLDKALLFEHSGKERRAVETLERLASEFPDWHQTPMVLAKLKARGHQGAAGTDRAGLQAQAMPNPFNPGTAIRFQLPVAGAVSLAIYNAMGQLVRTVLADQYLAAGAHSLTWDGRTDAGASVATGMYFYRLSSDGQTLTQKITLIR